MIASIALVIALSLAPAAPQPAGVASLAWMAGSWGGEKQGTAMEEHWTTPRADLMLGMHRDVFPSGKAFFEFLRIEARPDGIYYVASPLGKGSTGFKMVASAENRATFENPAHDFPQRILYWIGPDGSLGARVEGKEKGAARSEEWSWKKLAPCP